MLKYHNTDLIDIPYRHFIDYSYSVLIGDALRARRAAEHLKSPKDEKLAASSEQERKFQRRDLTGLF